MGDAFACDRCGNLRGGESHLTLKRDYNGADYSIWNPVDRDSVVLCDGCIEVLQEWWDNPLDDKTTR